MRAIIGTSALLMLSFRVQACNPWNATRADNSDLCTGQPCSFNGYSNSCESGCCVGAYCQAESSCRTAVALPSVFAVILVGWCMFVTITAYKNAEARKARLIDKTHLGLYDEGDSNL